MCSLEYIRETYGVPAKRGGRIRFTGGSTPIDGTITSASGPYIRVRLDDRKLTVRLHPTWEVEYIAMLEQSTTTVYRGARRRYFSREAAARSLAREFIRERCGCEKGDYTTPGVVCDRHASPDRYYKLVEYLADRFMRTALGKTESEVTK